MSDLPTHAELEADPGPIPSPRRRRRGFLWLWLSACALLVVALIGIGIYFAYRSEPDFINGATILISRSVPTVLGDPTPEDWDDYRTLVLTQCELIRSRMVLESAVSKLSPGTLETFRNVTDPVAWLHRHPRVGQLNDTEVVGISLSAGSPEERHLILNAILGAYSYYSIAYEQRGRMNRLETLKSLWSRQQAELKQKRRAVRDIRAQAGADLSSEVDLSAEEDEIRLLEELAMKIGRQMYALELELTAPPRTRVLSEAQEPTAELVGRRGPGPAAPRPND